MRLFSPPPVGAPLLLLLLLLSALLGLLSASARPKSEGALTLVESPETGGDAETTDDPQHHDDDDGDLEVVQPTEQWQTLRPDQAVPAGSHVRLNLQTGQREVRLGEQQLKWSSDGEKEETRPSLDPEELKQAMKKIKEDMKATEPQASQYRPLEELKRDMAQLDLLVETDVQVLRRLLDQFNSTSCTTEQRLGILQELEYMVHQVDNAKSLCSMGGLQLVLHGLNSSDSRMQESAALVLGSALSSNPVVQVRAADDGALHKLLTVLVTTQSLQVKKKALFAVASLLRHFPHAQHQFLSHGGLQVLSKLFRGDAAGVLRTRIVTLLSDLISEKELISQAAVDRLPDSSHQERVRQYSLVSLQEQLLEDGWCLLVPQLLQSSEHDHREKALQALLAMTGVCSDHYRSDAALRSSLLSLRGLYQGLVQDQDQEDSSGYYEEIVELIDELRIKMR